MINNKGAKMKNLKKIILTTLTATLLTGCCWTDHSDTIREVAEPMLKELDAFYKENKRHPNVKERDIMLKEVGCEMDGDVCLYNGDKIVIDESSAYNGDYDMWMKIEKTICFSEVYSNGTIMKVNCRNKPCIKLGQ
jgi:hypothetical protein